MVGLALEAARAAVDAFAAELAEGEAGRGEMVHVPVDVAGDEEVEFAIAVVIAEGCAGGPVAELDAGLFGNVGKGAVVVVVIEAVFAEVRDVEVGPAVVIVVADGDAEAPAFVGDAGFVGDVGEGAVVVVVEEGGFGGGGFAVVGVEGGAVDEVDVEPAVVIVVEEGDAGADGFKDVLLFGRAHGVAPGGEAGLFRDVAENDGSGFDEAAGGDGALFGIENGGEGAGGGGSGLGVGVGR